MTNITPLNTPVASITLTKTMLDKAIIDANTSIRNFSKLVGVNFDDMRAGDRAQIQAAFLDGTATTLSFYRTRNDRGDRRFSIQGIKKQADIGDTVAITMMETVYLFQNKENSQMAVVVNITKNPQYNYLIEGMKK